MLEKFKNIFLLSLFLLLSLCGGDSDREQDNASKDVEIEKITQVNLTIGEVIEDSSYLDFQRYLDVADIRIFILPEVSDDFAYKVADVYHLMLEDSENVNYELRDKYLINTKNNLVFQKIGYEGPERYNLDSDPPGVDCCPGKGYEDNHTDFIWEYLNVSPEEQIGEVIEHLLHTITGVAFALEFDEWNWENQNSKINLAMKEAVDKGIFDISSYEDIKKFGSIEDFNKITAIEFAFWGIVVSWDYADIYDLPHDEFTISTPEELKQELPIFYSLYQDTFNKIFSTPEKDTLIKLFE